jgi:hypothetical protein
MAAWPSSGTIHITRNAGDSDLSSRQAHRSRTKAGSTLAGFSSSRPLLVPRLPGFGAAALGGEIGDLGVG